MKQIFLILLLCFIKTAFTQTANPGGVKGASYWYVTNDDINTPSFKSKLTNNTLLLPLKNAGSKTGWLNYHPSLSFSNLSKLPVNLGNIDFSNSTYFTVYQPTNVSTENIIWHISKNQEPDLVFTTSRMADLGSAKYMNYTDIFPLNPKVNTYVQQKLKDSLAPVSQILTIGPKPDFPQLPVTAFAGLIPEIILYDRVLNSEEQIRVASYLALKYGATLSEPEASYLNSNGEQIWDGGSYSNYHNNIAGIARDDSSGLLQQIAASSNNPALLSISTRDSLRNNSSLLWGDNDLPLSVDEKRVGIPLMLQKKWVAVPHGISGSITAELTIDTKQMDAELPEKPVYWLAIDRTGTGNFPAESLELIKMNGLDNNGKAQFDGVVWKKGNVAKEAFGFVIAQDLLVTSSITNLTCTNPDNGTLKLRMWGSKPPYTLNLYKDGSQLIRGLPIPNNDTFSVQTVTAGRYVVRVSDAFGHQYQDSFYVNNDDAPQPTAVAEKYILHEGKQVVIDASEQMPPGLSYYWKGPGNFQSSDAKVSINMPGTYTLTCSKNGCSNIQEVIITRPPQNIFKSVVVYPNPSNGLFTAKITLAKPAPVSMSIYTEDGRLVANRQSNGFANYRLSEMLNSSGLYHVIFRSWQFTVAKKLVVVKQ